MNIQSLIRCVRIVIVLTENHLYSIRGFNSIALFASLRRSKTPIMTVQDFLIVPFLTLCMRMAQEETGKNTAWAMCVSEFSWNRELLDRWGDIAISYSELLDIFCPFVTLRYWVVTHYRSISRVFSDISETWRIALETVFSYIDIF